MIWPPPGVGSGNCAHRASETGMTGAPSFSAGSFHCEVAMIWVAPLSVRM